MNYKVFFRVTVLLCIVFFVIAFFNYNSFVSVNNTEGKVTGVYTSVNADDNDADISISGPQSSDGNKGFPETVEEIMERERLSVKPTGIEDESEEINKVKFDRRNLPTNPDSKPESSYPPANKDQKNIQNNTDNPQTVSTNWTAATVLGTNPTNSLPADNMGAVGPTQYIVAVNGRIVTFSKNTGVADGVINASTNTFFNSVRNGSGTSDPRIRYDRLSQKWFIVIINVSSPNRILLAVSNTSTITAGTTWLFYFITAPSRFYDYETLGIDNSALYIGTNDFNTALTAFIGCSGYVVNKANLISGTLTSTLFSLLPTSSSAGPITPQGVDNFDVSSTTGYFIGVDNATFGTLMLRRVSNPGGTPTISGNISITVNTTTYPDSIPHLGATTKYMDGLDDRLFAACIRNGRLWTAHNFSVNASGVASFGSFRIGTRWYELQNLTGTPSVVQSGTIYDPSVSNPVSYWIPSVMVSGQGHAAFIFSSAGLNARINESTCGRLSGGTLGTTQSVTNITASSTAYNINESQTPHRWGDYSYVSLDPDDDMTMWGVMGFCDASNSYGVRVAKLLAPPPPPLTSASPNTITLGQTNVNVIITGTPSTGEGFYDPGAGFTNRISAAINGGVVVNSVTYNSATQVTLNITTTSAVSGTKTVTITNPDGQSVASSIIFDVALPVVLSSFNAVIDKRDITLKWKTEQELNNKGFEIERQFTDVNGISNEWSLVEFVNGKGTTNTPNEYSYTDKKLNTGKYNYRLKQIDFNGNYEWFSLAEPVSVGVPKNSGISQNYPNPFNPKTNIDYSLSVNGKVKIVVYDITGREVKQIVNEFKPAGYYTSLFDASILASGIYFYRITTSDFTQVKKMLVVK